MSATPPPMPGYGIWDINLDGQRVAGFTARQWAEHDAQWAKHADELVRAEREACAKLIEERKEWRGEKWVSTLCQMTTSAIANAIRNRGSS